MTHLPIEICKKLAKAGFPQHNEYRSVYRDDGLRLACPNSDEIIAEIEREGFFVELNHSTKRLETSLDFLWWCYILESRHGKSMAFGEANELVQAIAIAYITWKSGNTDEKIYYEGDDV